MQEVEYYIRTPDIHRQIIYRVSNSICEAWDPHHNKWYKWGAYRNKEEILRYNNNTMKLANRKYLKLRGITIK